MNIEPIIVASIGILASISTASFSYYLTKRHQLKVEGKRLKEEYYRFFIKALSDVAIDNYDDDAQRRLSESFNSLIVIASPQVVLILMEFHEFIRPSNTEISRNSSQWNSIHDELLKQLVQAMRKDIYGKEKDIELYLSKVHLVGKAPSKSLHCSSGIARQSEN